MKNVSCQFKNGYYHYLQYVPKPLKPNQYLFCGDKSKLFVLKISPYMLLVIFKKPKKEFREISMLILNSFEQEELNIDYKINLHFSKHFEYLVVVVKLGEMSKFRPNQKPYWSNFPRGIVTVSKQSKIKKFSVKIEVKFSHELQEKFSKKTKKIQT